jgi:hypothetical protein
MKERRATSFHLTIILKVHTESQYADSMFLARILVGGMTRKIVSEQIPGNTFLLEALDPCLPLGQWKFSHDISPSDRDYCRLQTPIHKN